jgi:membrane protein YqaA with SNARE-associated domain
MTFGETVQLAGIIVAAVGSVAGSAIQVMIARGKLARIEAAAESAKRRSGRTWNRVKGMTPTPFEQYPPEGNTDPNMPAFKKP